MSEYLEKCRFCGEMKETGVWGSQGFYCYADECLQKAKMESEAARAAKTTSMIEQRLCYFMRAWIGYCSQPGDPFCEKHGCLKCSSCGAPATKECDETMGLVCGCPLCDDCEHMTAKDGTNGGLANMKHCKKGAQVHTPWYAREAAI